MGENLRNSSWVSDVLTKSWKVFSIIHRLTSSAESQLTPMPSPGSIRKVGNEMNVSILLYFNLYIGVPCFLDYKITEWLWGISATGTMTEKILKTVSIH